jgi:hypothetical protein
MKLLIDERIRSAEKEKLEELEYEIVLIKRNNNVYEEISAHSDIFACKVGNKIFIDQNRFQEFDLNGTNYEIVYGEKIGYNYPDDIKYNVCIAGKKAIHNFKYTDRVLKEELINSKYELINVNQGYTKCSIALIDDNSVITGDKGIYNSLSKSKFDILYLDYEPDIKLLTNTGYSMKKGFIGGSIVRLKDNIIVFGDLEKIDNQNQIRNFIQRKNLKIIEFKGLDVIDYGGVIEI